MPSAIGSTLEKVLGDIFTAAAQGLLQWNDPTKKATRRLVYEYDKLNTDNPAKLQLQNAILATIDALPTAKRFEAAKLVHHRDPSYGSDLKTRAVEKAFTAIDAVPASKRYKAAFWVYERTPDGSDLQTQVDSLLEKLEKQGLKPQPMNLQVFLDKMAALPGAPADPAP